MSREKKNKLALLSRLLANKVQIGVRFLRSEAIV